MEHVQTLYFEIMGIQNQSFKIQSWYKGTVSFILLFINIIPVKR